MEKLNGASLKYLKAFIDLDAVTLLVLLASEMKFYWDPKEQSTKWHPVNIRFTKKTSASLLRDTNVLELKQNICTRGLTR